MTEEEVTEALQAMETDPAIVTKPAYRANADLWPGHSIPFIASHLAYLKNHPALNPQHYLSNLRLMLRKRK